MPKKSKNEFDFGGYLQSEGLQFKRLNDQGQPVVLDTQSNQEGVFDVDGLLGSLGTTRNDTNISYNTMDNPVNISPLTVADRAKVKGLGNERGSVKFLRNKFEQVFPHEEKGLLVKNAGVWHQVDPTGLGGGNPWEMAKELTKDIADLSDIGLNA
ncbi:MAG: hypothetical protein KAS32_03580, partial [Candidatus Peribacteraceae bacterium]|nr:hypothetical protein [Candidatus Peribacteraceae bacterium]